MYNHKYTANYIANLLNTAEKSGIDENEPISQNIYVARAYSAINAFYYMEYDSKVTAPCDNFDLWNAQNEGLKNAIISAVTMWAHTKNNRTAKTIAIYICDDIRNK